MKILKKITAALLSCAILGTMITACGNTEPVEKADEMADIPSIELIKDIDIGWSLGNTLDATGTGLSAERAWGAPTTTQEMIDKVKAAGFNLVRVPVSWGTHLGEGPDYIIDPDWLNRVQEVVDYAYKNDMYVILNAHHETWYDPYYDNAESAIAELKALWSQIAERFKNYDEHLIFEGLNEPRKRNTELEWSGGDQEGWDVVNQLNAAFVETIRNADGNNPLRHLMVCGYAASSDTKVWEAIKLPENDDKIIVSIHAYLPYNFALADSKQGQPRFDAAKPQSTTDIDNLVNNIYDKFISKGIAAIIGEMGARNRDNTEARTAWAEYYTKAAAEKGIPCAWWDNNAFTGSGENFGLLKRSTNEWEFPEIVEALMKGVAEGKALNAA